MKKTLTFLVTCSLLTGCSTKETSLNPDSFSPVVAPDSTSADTIDFNTATPAAHENPIDKVPDSELLFTRMEMIDVREGPDENSEIIFDLGYKEWVILVETFNDWYKIKDQSG